MVGAATLTFLTPLGGLLALAAIAPLAGTALVSFRAAGARRALGLPPQPRRRLLLPVAASVAAAGLLGLAAAQPVFHRTVTRDVRTDAEAFVAVDVSRSMLARRAPGAATRLERARAIAAQLRDGLPDIPVGVASLTDRMLPHLFPSPDDSVFQATLARAIGVERPPPRSSFEQNATSLDALAGVASQRFFSPGAKRRLLVLLTDGESTPVAVARIGRVLDRAAIHTVFVQLWGPSERVYTVGVAEPQYRPDPSARTLLDALAVAAGGSVYSEDEVGAAIRRSRQLLGNGPTRAEGVRDSARGLTAFLALVAVLPIGVLLAKTDR